MILSHDVTPQWSVTLVFPWRRSAVVYTFKETKQKILRGEIQALWGRARKSTWQYLRYANVVVLFRELQQYLY